MRKLSLVGACLLSFNTLTSSNIANGEKLDMTVDLDELNLISSINKATARNVEHSQNISNNLPILSPLETKDISRISDIFGYRHSHPILLRPSFHTGIDFATRIGNSVKTTANGTITRIKNSKYGYGKHVVVDHGNGYETIYAHLSEINVELNEIVISGQTIGKSGNSGMSTGPHLHYEVRFGGKPIDPFMMYFEEFSTIDNLAEEYMNTLISLEQYNA